MRLGRSSVINWYVTVRDKGRTLTYCDRIRLSPVVQQAASKTLIPLINECNNKLAEIIFLPRHGEEIISVKILYDATCEDEIVWWKGSLHCGVRLRMIGDIHIYVCIYECNCYFIYIRERCRSARYAGRKEFKVKDGYTIPCNQL